MRDEEKTKEQLLQELRSLREQLVAQKEQARSRQRLAATRRRASDADLKKSQEDLEVSREETRAGNEALTEATEALGESQRELREMRERYNILGDLVPFGVWTSDPQGNVTYLSDTYLEMSGIELDDASLANWVGRLSPHEVKNSISEWQGTIGRRDIWEREHVVRASDGRQYTILSRGVPIVDEEGTVTAWLGINLDISGRKHMEDELKLAVDRLAGEKDRCEQEVQQRTRELQQATEQAESANRAKSEFLASMSHEIRTPMNGVIGMAELALMVSREPRTREYMTLVKKSGAQLLDIINDILDLSKIEAGKVELEEQSFDLREDLEIILSALGVSAHDKGLRFEHEVEPGIPARLVGDSTRLRQVLTNLIGNAIKYTPKGMISLSVHLAGEAASKPEGVRLLFRVRDTGIGIPRDKLAVVFDSFTRVEGPDYAKYGGTGLGLTISRRLVELMGGSIWVESEHGEGSTFSFTAEFGAPVEQPAPAERPVPLAAQEPPLKVLLVEDNEINRILAVELLEMRGHKVKEVENGLKALEALQAEAFDLVFMDARMPEMDGMEATRRIRAGEAGDPNVPIVALTAYALAGDREKFLAAGMDDYLSKPIDMKALERILGQFGTRQREKR